MSRTYVQIKAEQVPEGIRFDVPSRHQGQAEEVAFGGCSRTEHDAGDPYKRVTDRSVYPPTVTYYKRRRTLTLNVDVTALKRSDVDALVRALNTLAADLAERSYVVSPPFADDQDPA